MESRKRFLAGYEKVISLFLASKRFLFSDSNSINWYLDFSDLLCWRFLSVSSAAFDGYKLIRKGLLNVSGAVLRQLLCDFSVARAV